MSSRNVHLSPEERGERGKALSINKSLSKAKSAAEDGLVQCEKLRNNRLCRDVMIPMVRLFIKITRPVVFCVAALFGKVGLIDNMEINL
ncbi:hypothetical protein TSUD_35690 [Trifolium subterraneum]|uniref:Uncharacterized protein n=1 Tax=Trifolium subterraneum TaxID=3900 RepID=A0A2Z6MXU4_TRISU|nr:hypothetical protein TSUD_35690 [Trifolium subterraneum]